MTFDGPRAMFRQIALPACLLAAAICWSCWVLSWFLRHVQADSEFALVLPSALSGDHAAALEHARRAASADPDNAHYWGTAALLSERALGRRFDVEQILRPSTGLSRRGVAALGKSMEYYSRALDLNPNDDCFLHNIAWIHALMGRGELAYSYLERALAVYKTGEYQISAGLILERLGLEDRAFSAYVEALALEPDIVDSRFSQDLEKRYPGKIHELVDSAIMRLQQGPRSPILWARLGKLYLFRGKLEDARRYLEGATMELPNLPRPWFNLAMLAKTSGQSRKWELDLQRAAKLGRGDEQAWYHLARLFDSRAEVDAAIKAYLRVAGIRGLRVSSHARRSSRMYKTRFVMPDDVIPHGLLAYSNPPSRRVDALERLSTLYRSSGKRKLAERFSQLSQKARAQEENRSE